MPRLLINHCPLSPTYKYPLTIDGRRYWGILHYYFCEKYNWRDAFPNDDTKRYYELLLESDGEDTTVMLGRRMLRLHRRFKTWVNAKKPELGTVDNAVKLDVQRVPDWDTLKHDVMLRALRVRLSKPEVRQSLHKTHDAELVYRPTLMPMRVLPNPTWSVPGLNKYGRLLMALRREITCESDGIPVSIEFETPATIDWNGVEHDTKRCK